MEKLDVTIPHKGEYYIENNCYYHITDGNTERISNFIIESVVFVKRIDKPFRIYRIKTEKVIVVTATFTPFQMNNRRSWDRRLNSVLPWTLVWMGTMTDLQAIKSVDFEMDTVLGRDFDAWLEEHREELSPFKYFRSDYV